jgi:hypothetical protein
MNIIHKKQIDNKIQDRMNLSEMASKTILKVGSNPEKDKLINTTEKKTFFIYETKTDPLKEKTMERYKQKELILSSSKKGLANDKPEVAQYYEKYVK